MKRLLKISLYFTVILSQFLISCNNQDEVAQAEAAPKKITYAELYAAEEVVLSNYKLLDQEKGIYQIPVDRALMLVAGESTK